MRLCHSQKGGDIVKKIPKPTRLVPATAQMFTGLRVLLIDEEADVRDMFLSCLGQRGALVTAIGGNLMEELRHLLAYGELYDLVFVALPLSSIKNEDGMIALTNHPIFRNAIKIAFFQRDDVQARLLMHRVGITLHLAGPTPERIVALVANYVANQDAAWLL